MMSKRELSNRENATVNPTTSFDRIFSSILHKSSLSEDRIEDIREISDDESYEAAEGIFELVASMTNLNETERKEFIQKMLEVPSYEKYFLENFVADPFGDMFETFLDYVSHKVSDEDKIKKWINKLVIEARAMDVGVYLWQELFWSDMFWNEEGEIQEYICKMFFSFCEDENVEDVNSYLENFNYSEETTRMLAEVLATYIINKEFLDEQYIKFLLGRYVMEAVKEAAKNKDEFHIEHIEFFMKYMYDIDFDLFATYPENYKEAIIEKFAQECTMSEIINEYNEIWFSCFIVKLRNKNESVQEIVLDIKTVMSEEELLGAIDEYAETGLCTSEEMSNFDEVKHLLAVLECEKIALRGGDYSDDSEREKYEELEDFLDQLEEKRADW